jgi:two-component system sensor histidine kinase HydH
MFAVKQKQLLVAVLVFLVSFLHYGTGHGQLYYHVFYRDLYYLPLILAGVWFGLRGALVTSLSITILFLPYVLMTWHYVPILDFDRILEIILLNSLAAVLGIISDRERKSQKALGEARNFAGIGKAVTEIAHDIKAPLTAIGGFTRSVRKRLPADNPDREKLDIVLREVDRLETLLKEMLDFSRPMDLHLSVEDIKRLVESTLPLVEAEGERRNVRIETGWGARVPSIRCDQERIRQALLNLLLNAIQASPDGERVEIRARQAGARALIDVVDRGPGIPVELRENIFLPFFTTKSEGTGLGLPMALKIVQAHGGRLRAMENPDKGTIFRIALPLAP